MKFSLFNKKKNYYDQVCDRSYYDMHSHIIPAVDDGALNMEMALDMLNKEINQGVRRVILTPHIRRNENDPVRIEKHFRALRSRARRLEMPIRVYLGSEILYDSRTLERLRTGQAFTMAGTRYVLIEFAPNVPYSYLNNAMDELIMAGYFPILAHAERYGCIYAHLHRVSQLVEKGVYIQINAKSFLTHPKSKELVKLIEDGLVHFIGTDCHRSNWRPVCMEETCKYLATQIEEEDYCRIFFENPKKLMRNEVI